MEKLKTNIYFFTWMKHKTFYESLTFLIHQTINTNSTLPTWETTNLKRQITSSHPSSEEIKFESSKLDQEVIGSPMKLKQNHQL